MYDKEDREQTGAPLTAARHDRGLSTEIGRGTDANSSLRIEISAANEFDWQLDARIAGGSVEIGRIFCEGDSVQDIDVPDWVERVAGVVGERLDGGP